MFIRRATMKCAVTFKTDSTILSQDACVIVYAAYEGSVSCQNYILFQMLYFFFLLKKALDIAIYVVPVSSWQWRKKNEKKRTHSVLTVQKSGFPSCSRRDAANFLNGIFYTGNPNGVYFVLFRRHFQGVSGYLSKRP